MESGVQQIIVKPQYCLCYTMRKENIAFTCRLKIIAVFVPTDHVHVCNFLIIISLSHTHGLTVTVYTYPVPVNIKLYLTFNMYQKEWPYLNISRDVLRLLGWGLPVF